MTQSKKTFCEKLYNRLRDVCLEESNDYADCLFVFSDVLRQARKKMKDPEVGRFVGECMELLDYKKEWEREKKIKFLFDEFRDCAELSFDTCLALHDYLSYKAKLVMNEDEYMCFQEFCDKILTKRAQETNSEYHSCIVYARPM